MALKKEVIKYDLEGNEICRYNSTREAAISENISEDKIYKVINGKQKSVEGFVFKKSGIITNAVDKIGTGNYKCPYCERRFETYNGLCKHVVRQKQHGEITSEKLLTDFKYNGIRPTCKCGCGEYTSIDPNNEAHFCDYVSGHAIRIHNNWGHNRKAIENSANTRRQQYKDGTRVQWNKGKKWIDVFTDEEITNLYDKIYTEERSIKIHNRLFGVEKTEKHKARLKEVFNTEAYKKQKSNEMHNRIVNGSFSISSTGEEQFINECIIPLNIEYKKQYYIKEIKQYCDVYIPSKNLIIEYDGDFWHCNPEKYPDGPKYDYQVKHIEKDKVKNTYCKENNISILRIWESEFKNNREYVFSKIKKIISK